MNIKALFWAACGGVLFGCELLPTAPPQIGNRGSIVNSSICIWKAKVSMEPENQKKSVDCTIEPWFKYWSQINANTWPQRKLMIEGLSDRPSDVFKKVLLSQGKGTPYQDRLRAQLWLKSLLPMFSQEMADFIQIALHQPSQELLEMESALVTLSQSKANGDKQIEQQRILLDQQTKQIEQLLNIEASIIDSEQGEQ